jgi:hypothetical protein
MYADAPLSKAGLTSIYEEVGLWTAEITESHRVEWLLFRAG